MAHLADVGVDALIIQDLGVYHLVRRYFPMLELHASTQLAVHNRAGAAALHGLQLSPAEALQDEHNQAIGLFTDYGGVPTPRPIARFSRVRNPATRPPARPGQQSAAVLAEWGMPRTRIGELLGSAAVVDASPARPTHE